MVESSEPSPSFKPRPRSLPADFLDVPSYARKSSLFSVLPSAVQNRLPRLPSIRRSVSMYGVASKGKRKGGATIISRTPPVEYASAVVLSGSREVSADRVKDEYLGDSNDGRPSSSGFVSQSVEPSESKTGIVWKFANQGAYHLIIRL